MRLLAGAEEQLMDQFSRENTSEKWNGRGVPAMLMDYARHLDVYPANKLQELQRKWWELLWGRGRICLNSCMSAPKHALVCRTESKRVIHVLASGLVWRKVLEFLLFCSSAAEKFGETWGGTTDTVGNRGRGGKRDMASRELAYILNQLVIQ